MERIEEIRKHEAIADRQEHLTSMHRWMAAELIWEEVTSGTSRRELATEIGKSHTHVRYMFNCWDMVGRKMIDGVKSHTDLPNFNTVYNSAEVRGEHDPDGGEEGEREGSHRRKGQEPDDYSAHGLVMAASNSVDALARNRAYWPLLTDDDIAVLRELMPVIRALIRDIGR